ncbi:hypothetical protein GUJ93_ZPchr0458g22642 [Zizania palustris]|uniref:Uncharacterized protein n=1 Tax=Zizania palustris TaxID=103762 RepID=A0A8J5RSQ8_ZIZPA|nr:hypothetical protein GUJ93_ZPchr0458g22642 [Zizania palustris]
MPLGPPAGCLIFCFARTALLLPSSIPVSARGHGPIGPTNLGVEPDPRAEERHVRRDDSTPRRRRAPATPPYDPCGDPFPGERRRGQKLGARRRRASSRGAPATARSRGAGEDEEPRKGWSFPRGGGGSASSECYFGLNLRPMCDPSEVSYTIMPNMGYFELMPHDPNAAPLPRDAPPPRLVDLADAEVGREYELVTGFHNAAPQFRFVRRKNVLLSIDSDKTDEAELQAAVERASALLAPYDDASIVEYTSQADAATILGHYVVYWELMVREGGA